MVIGSFIRFLVAVWLIVGLVEAQKYHYFAHLHSAGRIVELFLAIIAWPLLAWRPHQFHHDIHHIIHWVTSALS